MIDEESVTEIEAEHENPVTSVTASGGDVTDSETEFVTEKEAEHENPVTSVTEKEAEHENPVTAPGDDFTDSEMDSVTSEKPDTKVIRLNVIDIERIAAMGHDGEKTAPDRAQVA